MMDISQKLSIFKRVGILGLGLTGETVFNFFTKNNIPIVVWDDNLEARDNFRNKYNNADIIHYGLWQYCSHIVISPGIALFYPNTHPIVEFANKNHIVLTSDIEILYELVHEKAKIIAITGTNGKSTTTSLIGHILGTNGKKCAVGGNIGVGALGLPLDNEIYVLELSSFQLELTGKFNPDVAIILNITPDHLDRHGSMKNYINAKCQIFKNQTEKNYTIIGIDSTITASIYEEEKYKRLHNCIGISTDVVNANMQNIICYDNSGFLSDNFWKSNLKIKDENIYLQGSHNRENFVAAYSACRAIGLDEDKIENALNSFIGLPHRMQFVGKIGKVSFYNDSKATNAEAARPALLALDNIYWLAGGTPKEGGIESIIDSLSNVKKAFLYGKASEELAFTLKKNNKSFQIFKDLNSALAKAYDEALHDRKESNILLSPACASYDQYKNFEERGNHFIQLFKKLR